MQDLQIRRRGFDRIDPEQEFQPLDCAQRQVDLYHCDNRQIDVVIDRFFIVEGDLVAFASGVVFCRRFFRFAVTVWGAAAFRARPHEILVARDAAAPYKSGEHQQRKQRIGEGSAHDSYPRVPTSATTVRTAPGQGLFWEHS